MIIIAQIKKAKLLFIQDYKINIFGNESIFAPSTRVSEPFKSLNRAHGDFYYRFANTKEKLLNDIENKKGTILKDAVLSVKNGQITTDIDSWFRDEVEVSNTDQKIDLKAELFKNEGKFVCFSFKQV